MWLTCIITNVWNAMSSLKTSMSYSNIFFWAMMTNVHCAHLLKKTPMIIIELVIKTTLKSIGRNVTFVTDISSWNTVGFINIALLSENQERRNGQEMPKWTWRRHHHWIGNCLIGKVKLFVPRLCWIFSKLAAAKIIIIKQKGFQIEKWNNLIFKFFCSRMTPLTKHSKVCKPKRKYQFLK